MLVVTLGTLVACHPTEYHYEFRVHAPADPAIVTAVRVTDEAIELTLTNHTDTVAQVDWNHLVLDYGDGTTSSPRPAIDLGWIAPGATVTAQLVPIALPHEGRAALRFEHRQLALDIPMIVRHEPRLAHVDLLAHVEAR